MLFQKNSAHRGGYLAYLFPKRFIHGAFFNVNILKYHLISEIAIFLVKFYPKMPEHRHAIGPQFFQLISLQQISLQYTIVQIKHTSGVEKSFLK